MGAEVDPTVGVEVDPTVEVAEVDPTEEVAEVDPTEEEQAHRLKAELVPRRRPRALPQPR